MEKELISIIVPIYNVEKYLEECIESLILQDYENIEIILVDDGSQDKSKKICDKYAEKHSNIKTYHKENGGLSDARNYGIKKANGKYICFVDSDDFVKSDYISSMYDNLKKHNVQISACGYSYCYLNGEIINRNFQNIEERYDKDEAQIYMSLIGYFNVVAWNKLYDKKLFDDIEFPKGKTSEDMFIMYKIIEKAGSIYYSSKEKYLYRQREGSITKNIIRNNSINIDGIEAAKEVYTYFKNNNRIKVLPYIARLVIFQTIGVYNAILCRNYDKNKMRELRKEAKELKKEMTYDKLSKSRKIQLYIFLHNIFIYNIAFKVFDKIRKKNYGVEKHE